jgi:hypothetical protein
VIRTLVFCLACFFMAMSSSNVQASSETLVWRAPIPANPPYQGEVRLIRRNSALVMQTILNSKVLKHVVAAIQKKEFSDWPEDREGWIDSRRYSDELYRAYESIQARAKRRKSSNRYLNLLIEFVLQERHSFVALYEPTLSKSGNQFSVKEKEVLKKMNTSRTYIYNNLQEIARDSFQLEEQEVLKLLQPIPGDL